LAILPIENLTSDPVLFADAGAIQLAIWESLLAQPALHPVIAGHRRDLPELQSYYVVEGYVSDGRFQLQLNGQPVRCAGSLDDCAVRLVRDIAGRVGVSPRPIPRAETLRLLANPGLPDGATNAREKAEELDSAFSMVWIGLAAQAQSRGGVPAALAVLNRAPLGSMAAFDASRVRLRLAELTQDRKARTKALIELARFSPADIELQSQAAQESASGRDFATAAQIYDRLIATSAHPRFFNQAAYLAAFMSERAKAERYAASAQTAAPTDPSYMDTRGEISYFFGDFAAASRYFEQAANLNVAFLNGQTLWKAADSARRAGDKPRAEALLTRYLDFRTKTGLRNTLVLQAIWDWRGDAPESAMEKLRAAANSTERSKALFLLALMALNKRDFAAAQGYRRQLEPNAIETAFLGSVMDGTAPPPGIPYPAEAITALENYLRGRNKAASEAYAIAKTKIDPFAEGQWRNLEAALEGRKPQGLMPASPDDWLAVLLR
jgi:hypothetical protein